MKLANNDFRDRTVPPDENYYSDQNKTKDVIDRQSGFNPTENYNNDFGANNTQSININNVQSRQLPPDYRNFNNRQPNQNKSKGKHKKKKIKVWQIIVAVLLAVVLLVTGLTVPVLNKINYDDKVDNGYVNENELKSDSAVTNILLLGVDARADEDDSTSRSDSMMLVSIDSAHHCIKLVSFLRDTWVYIPGADKNQRLNAACSLGGYQGVVDTIEYNFGIKIDGYVVTDFEMFKVMVDSIGGVEVDVTEKEANEVTNHQKRYDHVNLEPGKQILTGEQALAYCRIRKIDTDWKRTERQRTVMQEILKGVLHSGPITDYKMLKNVAPYIETNLSKTQLIKAGFKGLNCIKGGFDQTHLPFDDTWKYTNKGGASVISIDKDANKDKLIDYIYNQDKPAEEEN